ncbi:DUF6482 family protein [Paraferrimonas sp. SM1919]|uniref:DUF6482 family protein n=1 Tax=Paraferrimonas sp. SM1919 TaxID=2662263 RepID=UPI0013D4DD61|nr:DUF6482 family protein [Paraferrimonas sp. SM1919]
MSMFEQSSGYAVIIATADINDYQVGMANGQGVIKGLSGPACAHLASLELAKEYLRERDIHRAHLYMNTPYDEMCGLPSSVNIPMPLSF